MTLVSLIIRLNVKWTCRYEFNIKIKLFLAYCKGLKKGWNPTFFNLSNNVKFLWPSQNTWPLWGKQRFRIKKKNFQKVRLVKLSILEKRFYSKGDLIHMDSISTFGASAHNKCTCPYRMQMFVPFENASKNIAE